MILDKKVKVKITNKNIVYYSNFFTDISLKDIIEVDIETQLQKNSNLKFNVVCDICNITRYIKFQSYSKNINSCSKYKIYTCDKCSHIKLKETNKEKYGVEYYSQHSDRNEKVRKTSVDKYGVDHYSKTNEYKERISSTNLEKFGYENPFMDKERIKSSFKEKYGVEHPSQVEEFKDKVKSTNLKRYGADYALGSKEIREKINKTNLERYNGHPMKDDHIRYLNTIMSRDKDYISYEGNNISVFKCDKGHNFLIDSDLYHNRLRSNLPLCTICYPLNENKSIKEKELYKYIKSIYNGEIATSYRDSLEIDIYLPELKIGFEFNGLYWHSNQKKENTYHVDKTNYFNNKGIRIIHIWEDDWDHKRNIVYSQINNWIGNSTNKIYARKCEVREIDNVKISKIFLDENHIQGNVNSIKKYGLYYNDELVSIMIFDKYEGRKKMEEGGWNLSRFCNKLNTNIIGGASKLLTHFIKTNNPKRIVSYADKDWSQGDLYYKLGFEKISEGRPDYKYIIDNKRIHKSRFKKSKLNTDLSESKFMEFSGVGKIYDCGKLKFQLEL